MVVDKDLADVLAASGGEPEAAYARPVDVVVEAPSPDGSPHGAHASHARRRPPTNGELVPWPVVNVFEVADIPEIPFVVEGLVPERGRVLLAGPPKQGCKTWLLMRLALSVATGQAFMGFEVKKPGPVIYITGEERFESVHKRMTLLRDGMRLGADRPPVFATPPMVASPRLDRAEDFARIRLLVEEVKPALVVAEPWARLQHVDENSASEVGPILDAINRLTEELDVAFCMAHHLAKGRKGPEGVRGSGDLASWYDTGIFSVPYGGERGHLKLSFETRHRPVDPFGVRIEVFEGEGGCATVTRVPISDLGEVEVGGLAARILEAVMENTITSIEQVRRIVGKKKLVVLDTIARLEEDGRIDRTRTPWRIL